MKFTFFYDYESSTTHSQNGYGYFVTTLHVLKYAYVRRYDFPSIYSCTILKEHVFAVL